MSAGVLDSSWLSAGRGVGQLFPAVPTLFATAKATRLHVALILPFLHNTMPRLVDRTAVRGLSPCYELRLRSVSRYWMHFTDGVATGSATTPRRVRDRALRELRAAGAG